MSPSTDAGGTLAPMRPEGGRVDVHRPPPVAALCGRQAECEALDALVANVRAGRSEVLVLRGEAGIGKTALLRHLAERASGFRVARAAGVESEMELPFAGLHQLCAPFLDRLGRLPAPQQQALAAAFGLEGGGAPDGHVVGLAVLSLLCDVAEEAPLVCLVDDADWLDSATAQTLAFVARRLLAERVAVLFAARHLADDDRFGGLPQLVVGGLGAADARALLDSVATGPMDARVRERIIAETRGNPLALLELPHGLAGAELVSGFGRPRYVPLTNRMEEGFMRRLGPLPEDTRWLLLIAAGEPTGDVDLLWRASRRLGIGPDALGPAEAAGLLEVGARVHFRHPLMRSAAYRAAAAEDRRSMHRALAEETDAEAEPDRRAWHQAQATIGPDEAVAEALERSAGRALGRGGLAAAAALLARATELTPNSPRRSQRGLAAAQAKLQAGAADAALGLLAAAEAGPLEEFERAQAELLHAQIAFAVNRGSDAPPLLLKAAARLERLDISLARDTYLEALSAGLYTGRLSTGTGLHEVAAVARAAPAPAQPRLGDLLLDCRAALLTDGYAEAMPLCKRMLRAFCETDLPAEQGLRWLWLASLTAADLWDDESGHILCSRYVKITREAGALYEFPLAVNGRVFTHLFAGELTEAEALVNEVALVGEVIGGDFAPYAAIGLAAFRGREDETAALAQDILTKVMPRGEGVGIAMVHWTRAWLCNGLGRYEEALAAARVAGEHPDDVVVSKWALVELIEAASRARERDAAAEGLARLAEMTRAAGGEWALGLQARSRALLSEGPAAEALYQEAVERLGRCRIVMDLARAHLLYGEWLRRENRRVDARAQLRAAHELLGAMGAEAFAERARRELEATGETVRKRTVETLDQLTPQERQIARLAGDGSTNPEIGAQLFISPRTVEWHLRKVFTKLGIGSRKELREALPSTG